MIFSQIGVMCIGICMGFWVQYVLRRLLPPVTPDRPRIEDIITLLGSISVTGMIGGGMSVLPEGSMIGPYGVGLLIGLVANTGIILWIETSQSG